MLRYFQCWVLSLPVRTNAGFDKHGRLGFWCPQQVRISASSHTPCTCVANVFGKDTMFMRHCLRRWHLHTPPPNSSAAAQPGGSTVHPCKRSQPASAADAVHRRQPVNQVRSIRKEHCRDDFFFKADKDDAVIMFLLQMLPVEFVHPFQSETYI